MTVTAVRHYLDCSDLFLCFRRCGGNKDEIEEEKTVDDYEAAEERIFEAEKHAVEAVEKAIEGEVETMFHELPHREKKDDEKKGKDKAVTLAKK